MATEHCRARAAFKRVTCPGTVPVYGSRGIEKPGKVFVTIEWTGSRLSISGVTAPLANGDALGSCGQNIGDARSCDLRDGWTEDMRAKLVDAWDRWHLNDMRPGCEHQRDWPTSEKVEVVTYGLTSEAHAMRRKAQRCAELAAADGVIADLTATERALLDSDYNRHEPPDADSPLSGCYEVRKRETKARGWVTENEHPLGLLSKPCPVCDYRYGSRWLFEQVPDDVLDFLESLPDASGGMPTRWLR